MLNSKDIYINRSFEFRLYSILSIRVSYRFAFAILTWSHWMDDRNTRKGTGPKRPVIVVCASFATTWFESILLGKDCRPYYIHKMVQIDIM